VARDRRRHATATVSNHPEAVLLRGKRCRFLGVTVAVVSFHFVTGLPLETWLLFLLFSTAREE
jgi:hypothetical protein